MIQGDSEVARYFDNGDKNSNQQVVLPHLGSSVGGKSQSLWRPVRLDVILLIKAL